MPRMVTKSGVEFNLCEGSAQLYERKGWAKRVSKARGSPKANSSDSDYASIISFIAGGGASEFAHLAQAVVDGSSAADTSRLASQIVAAGDTAREGGPAQPKPTGLAAQIIAAGKKARGETA